MSEDDMMVQAIAMSLGQGVSQVCPLVLGVIHLLKLPHETAKDC